MSRYPQPGNEDDFEEFCLHLLRRHWNSPHVDRYGRRGQRQNGVDLLDSSGLLPLRGAQCKHHSGLTSLEPKELRAEVKKARKFLPALGIYVFLTSAKKSTETDRALLEINRRHRRVGSFTVELLTWEGIERLLEDYPDVAARLARVPAAAVTQAIAEVSQKVDGVRDVVARSDFDRRIEEAQGLLDAGQPEGSRLLLERIRQNLWHELTAPQRSKLCVRTADALIAEGQYPKAGSLLVEAASLMPDDHDAQARGAVGWELLNEPSKALAIAAGILTSHPLHLKAAIVYARTSPTGSPLIQIANLLSGDQPIDAELELAVAQRELDAKNPDEAIRRSRRATVAKPEWGAAWLFLGNSLLSKEVALLSTNAPSPAEERKLHLEEARSALGRSLDLSKGRHHLQAEAFCARARVRALLRDPEGATSDVDEALRILPKHPEALLLRAGQKANAREELAALRIAAEGADAERARLILGIRLLEVGNENERAEGTQILSTLARQSHAPTSDEAATFAARGFLALRDREAALTLAKDPTSAVGEIVRRVIHARVALFDGDTASANREADEARARVSDATNQTSIRALAQVFGELDRHSDAVALWERIAPPGAPTPDTAELIQTAHRAGRHEIVVRYCRSLREAGYAQPHLVDLEASIVETYDRAAAVELLQSYLSTHSDDNVARLRLSELGRRLNRSDLVCADLALLPGVEESSASVAYFVVQSLLYSNRENDAVEFAYRFVRRNVDNADAHRVLLSAMSPAGGASGSIPVDLDSAGPGAAVRYHEDGQDGDVWIVLEDGTDLHPEFNEVRSDSASGARFVGKRVGERVLLATGVQDRWATVLEIVSKYVRWYRETMNTWQVRFPEDRSIQMISVGDLDATSIAGAPPALAKVVDERASRFAEVHRIYSENIVPVAILAEALGVDIVSAVHGLAGQSGLKCSPSDLPAARIAAAGLMAGKALVLDATTLGTILLLEADDLLKALPVPLITTYATCDELDKFLEAAAPGHASGQLGRVAGELTMTSHDDAEAATARETLQARIASLKARLTIRGAQPLAAYAPSIRSDLIKHYGQSGAEAIAVANESGSTLWSDDITTSLAAARLGIPRTWTEFTIRHFAAQGALSRETYEKAAAKLIGYRYLEMNFSAAAFRGAGALAAWNPQRFPLDRFIASLGSAGISPGAVIRIAAGCIASLYLEVALPETRSSVLISLLGALPSGSMVPDWVPTLLQALRRAFGLNVVGLAEVFGAIDAWTKSRGSALATVNGLSEGS